MCEGDGEGEGEGEGEHGAEQLSGLQRGRWRMSLGRGGEGGGQVVRGSSGQPKGCGYVGSRPLAGYQKATQIIIKYLPN